MIYSPFVESLSGGYLQLVLVRDGAVGGSYIGGVREEALPADTLIHA